MEDMDVAGRELGREDWLDVAEPWRSFGVTTAAQMLEMAEIADRSRQFHSVWASLAWNPSRCSRPSRLAPAGAAWSRMHGQLHAARSGLAGLPVGQLKRVMDEVLPHFQ